MGWFFGEKEWINDQWFGEKIWKNKFGENFSKVLISLKSDEIFKKSINIK